LDRQYIYWRVLEKNGTRYNDNRVTVQGWR